MTKNHYYFISLLLVAIGVAIFSCADPDDGVTSKPAPTITNHTPIDGMTDVSINTSIILDFDILVIPASGSITLNAQGENEITIPVTDTNQVTVESKQVTISPSSILAYNKTYTITIPEGAFQSEIDNVPTATETIFTFTTEAIVDPVIETFSPSDNATQVAIDTPIVLNFNIPITAVTGNDITITSTGEAPITIPVDDARASISDRIVTITLADNLAYNKIYTVTILAGAFQNVDNVLTATETTFSFTTATGVLIHSLVLENTNANPQKAINLAELEVYTNHTRQGVNFATNAGNTIISGMVEDFSGPNVADRLVDGNRNNVALTDIYHSFGIFATENWVKLSFDPPIFLDTNNNDTSLLEVVVYNRENNNNFQDKATNLTVHLYNESDTQIATFGIGLSLAEAQNDILSFPFDLLFDPNTPPMIINHTPTDNATDVLVNSSITLDFNISRLFPVASKNITITPQGDSPITIATTDTQVTIIGNTVTVDPPSDLLFNKPYSVNIEAGAFKSSHNVASTSTTFSFSTSRGVFIHSLILENTNANPQSAINLAELEVYTNHTRQGVNFATNADNTITSGTVGNFGGSDNIADRLVDGNRANVALTDIYHSFGTFATENWVKLSFDPPIFLDTNNNDTSLLEVVVYNRENRNNFQDRATNLTVHLYNESDTQIATFGIGLSLAEAQNDILSFPFNLLFDTTTIPMIISHTPTDNATDVVVSSSITLNFNIRVSPVASKNITLTPNGGSPIIIAATDPQVRVIGNTVTVDPTSDLMLNKQYSVNIETGAFKSVHNIASTTSTSFTFTTESPIPPMVVSHTPVASATDILMNANIILTFNTPITAVSGNNITLTPTASSGTTVTIAVDDASQVNIVDRVVTINPTVTLDLGEYTFNVPAGAFKNNDNMPTTIDTTFTFNISFVELDLNADNNDSIGITFGNNMFWVVDITDDKVYAYDNTGAYSSGNDFDLDSQNETPRGITFANNKFWVVDISDDKVYAYDNTGAYSSGNDFDLDSQNGNAEGITFGNNMFWVVDFTDNKVYAYDNTGAYSSGNDFDLDSQNETPRGITFANNKFWVVDQVDRKVYAYDNTGARNSSDDFNLAGANANAQGITFADNNFWVVDFSNNKVYVYDINGNRP